MVSQTNEQALEALIEKALTDHCLEEIKANEVREANSVRRGLIGVSVKLNIAYAVFGVAKSGQLILR